MVADLVKAAVAAGADGLMIEVHNNPDKAWCDGAQSITPAMFADSWIRSANWLLSSVGKYKGYRGGDYHG